MLKPNFIVLLLTALIPLITGFIWYNSKTFGNAWMKAADMTPEKAKGANMALVFGLTYLFSFLLAIALSPIVIHQYHLFSIVMGDPDMNNPSSELGMWLKGFYDKYGNNYRTFKHGTLHGSMTGIFIALPILAVNAMFERKGFKYVAINAGYWIVTMALMGGVICQFN
jgi:hypothetical protein